MKIFKRRLTKVLIRIYQISDLVCVCGIMIGLFRYKVCLGEPRFEF